MPLLDLIRYLLQRNAQRVTKKISCAHCVTYRKGALRDVFDLSGNTSGQNLGDTTTTTTTTNTNTNTTTSLCTERSEASKAVPVPSLLSPGAPRDPA